MIFLDTETCGLHGFAVLLQWAKDDGPINLWSLWIEPVGDTLDLLEEIANDDVCGFNLTFDWFHIAKIYTTFKLFADKFGFDACPVDHIDDVAELESEARTVDFTIKPRSACDLMLHARKGKFQSLMARKDIRIRRVPTALAFALQRELEERIEIDGVYFSRRKDKYAPMWTVYDIEDQPEFKDVCLKFSASGALKVLAQYALGVKDDEILKFVDIEVDKSHRPYEQGWAPFCYAFTSREKKWRVKVKKDGKTKIAYAWPFHIKTHIDHWAYNDLARKYGANDVDYTRRLWYYFNCPEPGDDDSELACMVGAVRWRGYNVDIEKIKDQKRLALKKISGCPIAPKQVHHFLSEVMDPIERSQFKSTKKVVLEKIAGEWKCDCKFDCTDLEIIPGLNFGVQENKSGPCARCNGSGKHPAASRAKEVLDARKAKKEIEVYDKLIIAGRFHASFIIIGTLSSRMSGSDGLNAQGINHKKEIRDCFTLADDEFDLCGGDFDSFEVVIAEAAYDDEALRRELTEQRPCQKCDQKGKLPCSKCTPEKACGKCQDGIVVCDECEGTLLATYKIHGLFGMEISGLTYGEVLKSKGTDKDWYTIGKSGVFAMFYGGDWNTLVKKQNIDPERAQKAEIGFGNRFPGVQKAREKIFNSFCSMRQPAGIGSKVVWEEPEEFIESLLGFRRYFTLENKICKALFDLANKPPKSWKLIKQKVVRKEGRQQMVGGAVSSALYGAAFGIQSSNMRAAANHVIQSTGATITKRVERRIWDHQPYGVHQWIVIPMNIHDEIACPTRPEFKAAVKETVDETVESFRPTIPLIKMDWGSGASSWATMK